jgi:PAS domain S-box-containing protein
LADDQSNPQQKLVMQYLLNVALYKSILDSSADLVFLKDSAFTYLMVNKANADFFGKTPEDVIGLSDYDLMPTENADSCRLSDQRAIEQNKTLIHVEKVGAEYWETHKFPVLLPDGQMGVGGIIRNITEIKHADNKILHLNMELEERVKTRTYELEKMNQELKKSNLELEAFTYTVSHDLKTPLRAIDGFSGLLQERVKDSLDPESARFLKIVRDNTRRMDQLIKDLLFFARAGRTEINLVDLDIMEMVRSIFNEINNPEDPTRINLVIHTLPEAVGDPSLMRQVWINLIDNAIKYTRKQKNPSIEIGSYPQDNRQIYYIRDNGVGFNPAYSDKMFGVFQRLHGSDEFEGTGVGLAVVKRILQRHDGDIWAEGKVGEGAKFYFSLPIKNIS